MASTKKNWIVICLGIALALTCFAPGAFFILWIAAAGGSDAGSPELAREWAEEISQYNADSNRDPHDCAFVVACEDGDWAIGRAQGSHGMWKEGGGTVVVRDANGSMRYFSGHVCSEALGDVLPRDRKYHSLQSFFEDLTETHDFKEQTIEGWSPEAE